MDNDFNYLDLLGIGYNKDNLYHIIDRFLNSELTDKLKAAILANQYYESGFKEDAVNGSFYGINLWNKSQRQHYGDNLDSLIDYLLLEMTPDRGRWPQKERKETWNGWNPKYYKIWTNSDTSVPDLAKAFSLGYERHTQDENDPNVKLRTKLAEQIYKSLIERNSRKNNMFKNYLRWSSNIISRSKKIMNTKKYFIGGTLIPIYRRGSEFGTAFALARKRGDKTFVYNGNVYTTELKDELTNGSTSKSTNVTQNLTSTPYDSIALKLLYIPGETWVPQNRDNAKVQLNGRIKAGVKAMLANGATTEECAEWANDQLLNAKYPDGSPMYNMFEVGGDAWNRATSGKHSKIIYDAFNNIPLGNYPVVTLKDNLGKTYKDVIDPKALLAIRQNNRKAVDIFYKNFKSSSLDPNKNYIATMTYYSSPNVGKAYAQRFDSNNTNITSTHTGNVYFDADSGRWRVLHNIHGKLYDDDLIAAQGTHNGLGYGITAISELSKNPTPNQRKTKQQEQQKRQQEIKRKQIQAKQKAELDYSKNHLILSKVMSRDTANRWFGWTGIKFAKGGYIQKNYIQPKNTMFKF